MKQINTFREHSFGFIAVSHILFMKTW